MMRTSTNCSLRRVVCGEKLKLSSMHQREECMTQRHIPDGTVRLMVTSAGAGRRPRAGDLELSQADERSLEEHCGADERRGRGRRPRRSRHNLEPGSARCCLLSGCFYWVRARCI